MVKEKMKPNETKCQVTAIRTVQAVHIQTKMLGRQLNVFGKHCRQWKTKATAIILIITLSCPQKQTAKSTNNNNDTEIKLISSAAKRQRQNSSQDK